MNPVVSEPFLDEYRSISFSFVNIASDVVIPRPEKLDQYKLDSRKFIAQNEAMINSFANYSGFGWSYVS